jgi:hypothetical protein
VEKITQPKAPRLNDPALDAQLREIREALRQIEIWLRDLEARLQALE